jgi:hypothetical protein
MADILGIGLTHFPGLAMPDAEMSIFLRNTLARGDVPPALTDPANWPEPMRREWSDDRGAAAAAEHRRRAISATRKIRAAIDEFAPDVILIFGDDQYENFIEDIVPPFCIFIIDHMKSQPYLGEPHLFKGGNVWNEPNDALFVHRGHPQAARYLANHLNQLGWDLPYAYRLRHGAGLAHAFINTLLFLDFDRTGFPYAVLPFHVNCYGGELVRRRGGGLAPGEHEPGEPDPPAPSAQSCFDLGRAIARVFRESKYRVAIAASSSWSHAFLTKKNNWIYPDHESDRRRLQDIREGRFICWRKLTRAEIEAAGQHEFLNWICLAGAMAEIGARPDIIDYLESYILNSNKCFAIFRTP